MSKKTSLAAISAMSFLVVSCSKPDSVKTIKLATSDVFLTIETYDGNGPVDADDTRLYANFAHDGSATRALILEGEDLTISKLIWTAPDRLVICISGGITDTFRNQVTLIIGRDDRKIHSVLKEDC